MKIKTSELSGKQLDWAVAQIEGYAEGPNGSFWITEDDCVDFKPTTDWVQGGPIIEREVISVGKHTWDNDGVISWGASKSSLFQGAPFSAGPTLLIAAMRCYVASKLGEEVETPEFIDA